MFRDLRATDVLAAGALLRPLVTRTPLEHSDALTARAGAPVWLKLENQQRTGSFKVRGALTAIAWLPDDVRARGIVASSAGNHGLGVAYAAKQYGIPAKIFVPADAPRVKREGIEALGARVDASQPHYDAAHAAALVFAEESGMTFVDPCSGAPLLAGQGTVALEILEALPRLGTLVVPVGGGGLLGGCASLVQRVAPDVTIIGVQSEKTDAMARSLAAGRIVEIGYEPTLADGLAGQIEPYGFDVGENALDGIVTVSEDAISRAIAWLSRAGAGRVEGSGAVGVAALLEGRLSSLGGPVAVVVSGGNIDPERHARICETAA